VTFETKPSVTLQAAQDRFAKWVLPDLSKRPVAGIAASDLLACLRRIARYAIATGRAERDVSADVRGALAPKVTENHAGITDPVKVGTLLRAIDGFQGSPRQWLP